MRPNDHELNWADWHKQKTYDSLMSYGTGAIRFIMLSNGGAVLALLTFIGHHTDKINELKFSMMFFITGSICGGLVNITAYLTQLALYNEGNGNCHPAYDHRIYLYISIALIVLGVIMFSFGALSAIFSLEGSDKVYVVNGEYALPKRSE